MTARVAAVALERFEIVVWAATWSQWQTWTWRAEEGDALAAAKIARLRWGSPIRVFDHDKREVIWRSIDA